MDAVLEPTQQAVLDTKQICAPSSSPLACGWRLRPIDRVTWIGSRPWTGFNRDDGEPKVAVDKASQIALNFLQESPIYSGDGSFVADKEGGRVKVRSSTARSEGE